MSIDCSFKSLTSSASSELLQSHNSLTFKLLKTVADFSQALANLHDKFGHELQMLVETFRKRNGELRKERLHCPNSLFQIWELFLQQVEVNSQQHGDISRNFNQTIGNGLIERVFHRKIQSKKIFAHRERIETILIKSNELLLKCYSDYCQAYALAITNPAPQHMSEYIASHNVYVHQLQATNGMIHAYQTKALPRLLEELEECHLETSLSISSSLLDSSELVSEKSNEQVAGYQMIASACRQANHKQDLAQFVKLAAASSLQLQSGAGNESQLTGGHQMGANQQLDIGAGGNNNNQTQADDSALESSLGSSQQQATGSGKSPSMMIRYHQFQAPSLTQVANADLCQFDPKNMQLVPTFKNEIAPDLSQPPAQQQPQLEKDRESLEEKTERLEERIESLNKLLARSSESRLHNKVNELQEELCQKRYELLVAQIHLSAVRSQLQLFEYNYRPASTMAHHQQLKGADGLMLASEGLLMPGGGQHPATGNSHGAHSQAPVAYRSKWIKAFKSLKETPAPNPSQMLISGSGGVAATSGQQKFADSDAQNKDLMSGGQAQNQLQQQQGGSSSSQQAENQHFFQEYTFKKIASCDVCKDFLRGHMRQGVKCKLCKISCHNDCQNKAHATIKCQQPKIKLLRRQKSAGELEVNNSDLDGNETGERPVTSKPDGIYSLIRQVLEAKKKGNVAQQQAQLQQQQQQQLEDNHLKVYGALNHMNMMNLSSGNLALANQNGKSVSTSALGNSSNLAADKSVDRWAVVMDLLAESRRKDKQEAELPPEGAASNTKRHSKQLDKFKLAAKSAAAASKSQRHYIQQQQQQQPRQNSPAELMVTQPDQHQAAGGAAPIYHQPAAQQSAMSHHLAQGGGDMASASGGGYLSQQAMRGANGLGLGGGGNSSSAGLEPSPQQQQPLHLHHTKSLPVGKLSATGKQREQQQLASAAGGGQQQAAIGGGRQQQQMGDSQPQLAQMATVQQQQSIHVPYQLLNIGSQQLQSTSAPHSPQRKRFNLRMKSFSLDSPESPSVGVGVSGCNSVALNYPSIASTQQQLPADDHRSSSYGQQQSMMQQQQHGQQQQMFIHDQQQQQHLNHQLYLHQQQQQQYQQQQVPTFRHYPSEQRDGPELVDDNQLNAYLSATGCGRHSSAGGQQQQQLYHHRHSYHNPSTTDFMHLYPSAQLGGSQVALNSAQLQQQQQQAAAAATGAGGKRSSAGGLPAGVMPGDSSADGVAPDGDNRQPVGGGGNDLHRNEYYDLGLDMGLRSAAGGGGQQQPEQQPPPQQQQQQQNPASSSASPPGGTYVVLYDYVAQRNDELQLAAGQLACVLDTSERDWWELRPLDGSNRVGYFPASYLAELYPGERPLQVTQTIQVSNGETCDKLLRGQIVIHAGKQMDGFVTIRLVAGDSVNHYIQCPEKYLMEVGELVGG